AGAEQAFRGVDVADADDGMAVHEKELDGRGATTRGGMQPVAGEGIRERLDAQRSDEGMSRGIVPDPERGAETARVAQAQGLSAEDEIEMLVLPRRLAGGHQAQAAGHAQVQDQRTLFEAEQQILAAPVDVAQGLSGEPAA